MTTWADEVVECAVELARREDMCACATCRFARAIGDARKLPRMGADDEELAKLSKSDVE